MMTALVACVSLFIGYQYGSVKGYEKKESHDRDVESFWSEVTRRSEK